MDINIESAIKSYMRQRQAIRNWNKKNPDKQKAYSKTNYDKMKNNNPEKYKAMLQRKKENYIKRKLENDAVKINEVKNSLKKTLEISSEKKT